MDKGFVHRAGATGVLLGLLLGVAAVLRGADPGAVGAGGFSFEIQSIRLLSNRVELTVASPPAYTGRIDIFSSSPAPAFPWTLAAPLVPADGARPLAWSQAVEGVDSRYYAVGDALLDRDGDGLADARELFLTGTSADNPDADGDLVPDGLDPHPTDAADADGNGIPDDWETVFAAGGAGGADADGDGVGDAAEHAMGTDPTAQNRGDAGNATGLEVWTPAP